VKDPRSAKDLGDAITLLLSPEYPDWRLPESFASDADRRESLANLFFPIAVARMKGARLAVSRTKREELFLPTIVCEDMTTAAFVFASYRGVKACVICRKLFFLIPNEKKPNTVANVHRPFIRGIIGGARR